ncbi:hypothetical protein SERLA73DRAFT_137206 [Serpula lacrymans var. lacrymans S7.3]|uniref:Uncharacterized protein n=2 Tax=Serpula lacrymans var. lacrymans TaxID=341189 RepID=F8PYW4_SERL3|nr:hypothetical protein SERLA73DRAFT_137206 [Serpula lacrymans var. lacrymans S7.3]
MDMDRMTVTTSTVSVGSKPARRRSSTITTAIPAKLKKDKDKSETHQGHRSQMSAMSPTILERGNIRISTATSPKSRSNPLIRHARSGSNLQMRSTAHNIAEVTSDQEGGDTDNATGSGSKKRQNGIMRGMSIRAEKFVRGLDSALEFVEGRT